MRGSFLGCGERHRTPVYPAPERRPGTRSQTIIDNPSLPAIIRRYLPGDPTMTHPANTRSGCADFHLTARLNRRQLLHLGGLTGMGLFLPDLFRARALCELTQPRSPRTFGRAKSVIMLYLHGGHAQQETWDPKPDGPVPEK